DQASGGSLIDGQLPTAYDRSVPVRHCFPLARPFDGRPTGGPVPVQKKTLKEKTVMRKLVLVVCSLVLCVAVSAAEDKISSQWKCDAKAADEHSIAVGDQDGHAYHIGQGKCASEKGTMGD